MGGREADLHTTLARPLTAGGTDRERRLRREVTGGLALSVILAGFFLATLESVVAGVGVERLDAPVSRFVAAHRTVALIDVSRIVTDVGSPWVIVPVAALVVGLLIWRFRLREAALFVAISSGGGGLSALGLKYVVHRVRPPGALVHLSSFSFPSGHVVGTLALCAGVTWVLSRYGASRHVRLAAWTGSFLLTIAVGVSRIELEVHYTSDVIGGFALAAFWLAAAATLWAARDLSKLPGDDARVTIDTQTR